MHKYEPRRSATKHLLHRFQDRLRPLVPAPHCGASVRPVPTHGLRLQASPMVETPRSCRCADRSTAQCRGTTRRDKVHADRGRPARRPKAPRARRRSREPTTTQRWLENESDAANFSRPPDRVTSSHACSRFELGVISRGHSEQPAPAASSASISSPPPEVPHPLLRRPSIFRRFPVGLDTSDNVASGWRSVRREPRLPRWRNEGLSGRGKSSARS